MGIYYFNEQFLRLAKNFHRIRAKKKVKTKILINKSARHIAEEFKKFPPAQIKLMPKNIFTPAIFLIYQDKVVINMPKDMTSFVLKSKNANEAFEVYFNIMWAAKGNEKII